MRQTKTERLLVARDAARRLQAGETLVSRAVSQAQAVLPADRRHDEPAVDKNLKRMIAEERTALEHVASMPVAETPAEELLRALKSYITPIVEDCVKHALRAHVAFVPAAQSASAAIEQFAKAARPRKIKKRVLIIGLKGAQKNIGDEFPDLDIVCHGSDEGKTGLQARADNCDVALIVTKFSGHDRIAIVKSRAPRWLEVGAMTDLRRHLDNLLVAA